MRSLGIPLVATALVLAACGGDDADDATPEPAPVEAEADQDGADAAGGLRTVGPEEIAGIVADPPAGLVILDVRTPMEFDEAHLEGATLIDFYEADFADQLAELDRDTPYVLYCRSGNRSGQTLDLMRELGFTDVSDTDGGIVAWAEAGLPMVAG